MMGLAVNPEALSQARATARSHINDVLIEWTAAEAPMESPIGEDKDF